MRNKIAAGNWKMNGIEASLSEITFMATQMEGNGEVIFCVPYTLLSQAVEMTKNLGISIGAQNAHFETLGAFTGEISAPMLKDIGVTHVILGHSERRALFGETSEIVARKAIAAHDAGLIAIICVGETLEERESGQAISVVSAQINASIPKSANAQNTIIAYEPVWAIGTGKVPTNDDIAKMHESIRSIIPQGDHMRVLYGGSVKASNAREIFSIPNVDGGLVGGASLKADDFIPIINATKT